MRKASTDSATLHRFPAGSLLFPCCCCTAFSHFPGLAGRTPRRLGSVIPARAPPGTGGPGAKPWAKVLRIRLEPSVMSHIQFSSMMLVEAILAIVALTCHSAL